MAVAAIVVIGIVLLTGNDTGAQLFPSSPQALTVQNTTPAAESPSVTQAQSPSVTQAQTDVGTLAGHPYLQRWITISTSSAPTARASSY